MRFLGLLFKNNISLLYILLMLADPHANPNYNDNQPNKRNRKNSPTNKIQKVPDEQRFLNIKGFNDEKFTVDTVDFDPVKKMRITPMGNRGTSLYSTGNIETNDGVTSHEIRGDYSPAIGSIPKYGKDTYHRNMFKDDSHYIPQSSYIPLATAEIHHLLENMPLKRKRGAGKTKKKNNKSKKKKNEKKKTKSKGKRKGGNTPLVSDDEAILLRKVVNDDLLSQSDLEQLIFILSKTGCTRSMIGLLISKRVNINIQNYEGNTPLMVASKYGHHQIVQILLNNGADVHIENYYNRTATDFAMDYLNPLNIPFSEKITSKLFTLLENAGGRPGSEFLNRVFNDEPSTGSRYNRTTSPGRDGGKK